MRDVLGSSAESVVGVPALQWFRQWDPTDNADDGVDYILLGTGSDLSKYDLEPILTEAFGAERARAELERFISMLADEHAAWTLEPIPVN